MAARNFHLSNASLLTSFFIFAVVLQFLPKEYTSPVNNMFFDLFNPLLKIGRDVQMDVVRLRPGQEDAVNRADYERLWKVYKNTHAQLLKLHEDYEQIANIRSALPRFFSGLVQAHVTSTPSSFSHEIIINKGTDSFVQTGQLVLSAQRNSVIGVVRETAEQMARVRLLTDSNQGIEVRIRREGSDKNIGAMMFGTGRITCKINMIEREQDIRAGDTVYAAPQPGKLDIPIVIGEIIDVQADELHPLLWDITVQPVEDMTRLDTVAVIVTDLSPLNPKGTR
jgi:rod shape-determining protein MreC